MNAEEPLQSAVQTQQGSPAQKLPEDSKNLSRIPMLQQVSFLSLIHQWQPMGFRVRVDIPFISDDASFLFLVRNGPYIPPWYYAWREGTPPYVFHWNNTRPVMHALNDSFIYDAAVDARFPSQFPDKFPIYITQHDLPPVLATLAASFRKWRGDMQYRIRVVAGFATQGYLITTPIKNAHLPIGVYDEYSTVPPLVRQDLSFREGMINSYVPSDTSMFRHTEVTYPYEYPVPWYDQYHWLEQRTEVGSLGSDPVARTSTKLVIEPHGDNYLAVGFRGALESTKDSSFIVFELEYRASEGFEFADPGVPPYHMLQSAVYVKQPYSGGNELQWRVVKTIPSKDWQSNGIDSVTRKGAQTKTEAYKSKLAELVLPSTISPIVDHGKQPDLPTPKAPIYQECRYDSRSKTTYCLDNSGVWHSWPGDKRSTMKSFIVAGGRNPRSITEEIPELALSERERDFEY